MDIDIILSDEDTTEFMDLMPGDDDIDHPIQSQEHATPSSSMESTPSFAEEQIDLDFDFEGELYTSQTSQTSLLSEPEKSPEPWDERMDAVQTEAEIENEEGSDEEDKPPQAIDHIENMVLDFLTQLSKSGLQSDSESESDADDLTPEQDEGSSQKRRGLVNKPRPKIELQLADRRRLDKDGELAMRTIRYPRVSSSGSARPLAQLFNVLNITHEALIAGIPTTKRDAYYKDVALFKSQSTVNQLVDDLAATWDLKRSDLNIRAASKGLIIGSGLTIHLFSGESLTAKDTDGINIPVGEDIESFSVDDSIKWILIVEKEAVFQTLCRLGVSNHPRMPGRGLVITGKGYPDVATRHLVKSLADALPRSIPIVSLVDCDPYGLDILSVYRYGSTSMQHENDTLAARRVRWLGLRASELSTLGIDWDTLLPITKNDEKKILAMLQRPNMPAKWKKELTRTLHMRRKAEIEIISSASVLVGTGLHPLLAYVIERLRDVVDPLAARSQ